MPTTPSVGVHVLARDEAAFIGATVEALRVACKAVPGASLRVVDGGSTDGTPDRAESAGAEVVSAVAIAPELGPVLGKGDSLWRAALVAEEDVLVFLDADLVADWERMLTSLVGALTPPGMRLAKAAFTRLTGPPGAAGSVPTGGGRVTREVVRPFLETHLPFLAQLREPLSGQIAIRRDTLRALPVLTGFGLEAGMLLDVVGAHGRDAVVEIDAGEIFNPPQPASGLVSMAADVRGALIDRSVRYGWVDPGVFDGTEVVVPVERPAPQSRVAARVAR